MRASGVTGRTWSLPKSLFAILILIPFVYPLLFLVVTALRTFDEYNKSPLGFSGFPTLTHLRYAWDAGDLGQGMINSALSVSIGVACCCLVSLSAAYWFFRHDGLVAKALLAAILIGWIIPFAVYLVPFYIVLINLSLTNNLYVLGLAYGAIFTPFGVYFMLSYLRQAVPRELLEAASVDGASLGRVFVRIIVPLSWPATGALAALTFVWMWGDIIVSVVLVGADPSKFTIVLAANSLVGQSISAAGSTNTVQTVAAATLISLLPMLAIVYFAQRAIVRGFSGSGVK